MSDEKENNPAFRLKDLPLCTKQADQIIGDGKKIKLDCAKPIATGEGQYGTWNLWTAFVEHLTVYEGRGAQEKTIADYSGKAVFFAPTKLNENLQEVANGKQGVEILVKRVAEEGNKGGLITRYMIEKLSDGDATSSGAALTPSEIKLVQDTEGLIKDGHKITKEIFVQSAKDAVYGGNITDARAEELFNLVN